MTTNDSRSHYAIAAGGLAFVGWFALIIGRQITRGYLIVPAKFPLVAYWVVQIGLASFFSALAAGVVWTVLTVHRRKMK